MAYLQNCRYDIFLSYASPNDTPIARGSYRNRTDWQWVQLFRAVLEDKLRSNLGRAVSIFFDQDEEDGLRVGDGLHPKIREALDDSFLFLPLYSQAYRSSVTWCQMEASWFIKGMGTPPAEKRRVYITHLEKRIESEWQSSFFPDVCTFSMYSTDPATSRIRRLGENDLQETGFLEAITDFARILADRLKEEADRTSVGKTGEKSGAPAPAPAADGESRNSDSKLRKKVLLAAVPGELERFRRGVAAELTVQGWDVVPAQNLRHYDPVKCREETKADLRGAVAFVQILGAESWPHDYDLIQYDAAAAFDPAPKTPPEIICWTPAFVDLSAVADPSRKKWMEGLPLWRENSAEFERNLLARLNVLRASPRKPGSESAAGLNAVVGISTMPEDRFELGSELVDLIEQQCIQADTLGPEDLVNEIAQHGLLIAYGAREKEKECQRIVAVVREWRKRLAGPDAQGVPPPAGLYFADPPEGKRAPCSYFWLKKIPHGDMAALDAFIQLVRDYAA